MSKVKKFMSLFLMTVIVSSMFSVVFANDINNKDTLTTKELVRLLREAKGGEVANTGKVAMAVGVIGEDDDGEEEVAAIAVGEIGEESGRNHGLARARVTSGGFSGDYLSLSFEVISTASLMVLGTATITAYNNLNGQVLSSTQVTAASNSSTNNLSQKIFMWVGNAGQVKIKMSGAFVTVDTGQTYPLLPYKPFVVYR